MQYDAIVIGGGAAGFFGALNISLQKAGARILLLERSQKLLSKVRVSGGGRCNVTHHCFDAAELATNYPRGGRELLQAFHRFQAADTVEWFEKHGVALKTEADGRMFPITNSSQTIIDLFMQMAETTGLEIGTGISVQAIQSKEHAFELRIADGDPIHAKNVLIACGGFPQKRSYDLIEKLGIEIIDPVPSLFTFICADKELTTLAGLSVPHAQLQAEGLKGKFEGPLLVTHHGLSGPAVLKLSAFGARVFHGCGYEFNLFVNWLKGEKEAQVLEQLFKLKKTQDKKFVVNAGLAVLPQRLWQYFVQSCDIPFACRWADMSSIHMNRLAAILTRQEIKVKGKNTFKEEFVTAGGVSLKEVDFRSMESKKVKGLFFAGEILDIDGITGGFNFQAAWTTSWIVASAIAGRI